MPEDLVQRRLKLAQAYVEIATFDEVAELLRGTIANIEYKIAWQRAIISKLESSRPESNTNLTSGHETLSQIEALKVLNENLH